MSVLFKNGTVVTATGRVTADVYAEGGTIKAIGTRLDQKAEAVVNCQRQIPSARGHRPPHPSGHALHGDLFPG